MKKNLNKIIRFNLMSLLFYLLISCNNQTDYTQMYLNSDYETIIESSDFVENPIIVSSAILKTSKVSINYSDVYSDAFFLKFKNFYCQNSQYFVKDYYWDIDSFEFERYNSNTLFQIALDYEIILECDLELKEIFLKESLKQDSNNIFSLKEIINMCILSGKYMEALQVLQNINDEYKETAYFVEVKEYCERSIDYKEYSQKSIRDLLLSNLFDKEIDTLGYNKFW